MQRTDIAWIEADPNVLGGKPHVRGTRLSVEFILELLATGGSPEAVLEGYPQLTRDGLNAALRYAVRAMSNEIVWDVKISA